MKTPFSDGQKLRCRALVPGLGSVWPQEAVSSSQGTGLAWQTCRITVPKVGALALRLRSSDFHTRHKPTRSTTGENTQRHKVKHNSKLTVTQYRQKEGGTGDTSATQVLNSHGIRSTKSLGNSLSQQRSGEELCGGEEKMALQSLRCKEVICHLLQDPLLL